MPETALVDPDGRLVAAGPLVCALQAEAGGRLGEVLLVPGLALFSHEVRLKNQALSRLVQVARGEILLDLTIEAHPEAGGTRLMIRQALPRRARAPWIDPEEGDLDAGLAIEHAPAWAWACDSALRITRLDLPPELGINAAEVLGSPLTRLVRLIENDQGDLPLLLAVAAEGPVHDQGATLRFGPLCEYLMSATVQRDGQGLFAGFSGQAVPRPAETASTADPATAHALGEKLRARLRAPLVRIAARADALGDLQHGALNRNYVDYATDMASAARHLLGLIDDLADVQTVEQVTFAPPLEPVDLADIGRRAAGLLKVRAQDHGIHLIPPADTDELMAKGNFQRVLQILVNLIGNAVRHTPEGGTVRLDVEQEGDEARLRVTDQGIGIAPVDHERIFGKFERLGARDAGGSGLGLFISRRLAQAMNGEIRLTSMLGAGATFTLVLPVSPPAPHSMPPAGAPRTIHS